MKISVKIAIFVIATAIGMISTLDTIQAAHAAPQEPHGTCGVGGHSGSGAFGCAGNVGGFIVTPKGNCHTTAGPFNTFSC